jgi:serine/threonine protein kinase
VDTDSSGKYNLLDQLAVEFAERYRRGERPSLKEYIDRYPHLESDLREILPAMMVIEQVEEGQRAEAAPVPVRTEPHPECVGDYRIIRELGRGGMGVVYEAEQQSLGRRVALKVLFHSSGGDARSQERFRREARSAARLHHTNIVPVFDVGQEGNTSYYAMQFIQGQGLDQVAEELRCLRTAQMPDQRGGRAGEMGQAAQSLLMGRFEPQPLAESPRAVPANGVTTHTRPEVPANGATSPPGSAATSSAVLPGQESLSSTQADHRHYFRSVARVGQQTALALGYAHARGVIHRDIKPSNLLLDASGVVWVTDFGLAKTEDNGLTRTGEVPGTLRYMSPERFHGECDTRADVYALGLTLYEMLVLHPAFDAVDQFRLIEQIGHQEPARPRSLDPQIPRDLETIVLRAIEKDPRRRYPSADEMAEDLRRFLADEPIRARRVTLLERAVRWCRRNPAMAGLAASVLMLLIAVAVVASVGYIRTSVALGKEAEQRAAAEREREVARGAQAEATREAARSRRLFYDADMQLAARLWQSASGTTRAVAELLEAHVPRPGEEDLRDFTWRYQ